jgi:DNA-binding NtrC family response regulator
MPVKEEASMERGTVLIVDDEPAILRSLKALFDRDHHIITAASASEAMEIMRSQTVHVLVSDYKMPGGDGLSLLIEVKKKFPGTIRVLMTAFADMNLVVRALNEGEIHRFISKPYMSFEFRSMLKDCIRLSGILSDEDRSADTEQLVLLAHDSKISLSTLQIILGSSYRTLTTSSGPDLLDHVSKNDVSALVLGVGLEMLDGCTITSYLKKERKVGFPVIVWSRDISGPFEGYLRDCGADFWIDEGNPAASQLLRDYLRDNIS